MAQVDDYTAMYCWDLAAAVLKDLVDNGAGFSETGDWTTQLMRTADVTLLGDPVQNVADMEAALQHEFGNANDAFFRDFSEIFGALNTYYVTGSETGHGAFASMAAALADRHYRVPYNLYNAWLSVMGGTLTAAYLACTAEVTMYTCEQGSPATFTEGSSIPSDMSFAPLLIEASGVIGASDLDVSFTATYSDDTTASETETIGSGTSDGAQQIACSNTVTGDGVNSGGTTIPMSDTTGMVAGQKILLQDRTWAVTLTSDCDASATAVVENTLPFEAGDSVYLHDDDTADESATIESVDHETKTITLSSTTTGTFTTANNAYLRLQSEDGYGWTELVEIDTVNSNTSLVVTDALNHTYSDQAFAQRVIKSISGVSLTNGTSGDIVLIKAHPDRPGYTSLNT